MLRPMSGLTVTDHDRDASGMAYVYPVVSRRAQGVSVGINLNPNNACNWRCVYCQVPNLVRGRAPKIDLGQLADELSSLLSDIVHGDFMQDNVPEDYRRLNDIALSGNGEPTTAKELVEVIEVIDEAMGTFGLRDRIKLVMISNGSMVAQPHVQEALRKMSKLGGEVWFKLDRATPAGISSTNSVRMAPSDHLERLGTVAGLIPTYVQTCMFATDGAPPEDQEVEAYLAALGRLVAQGTPLKGVLLYGLARPSMQVEAPTLSAVSEEWLTHLGARIEALGLTCKVSV